MWEATSTSQKVFRDACVLFADFMVLSTCPIVYTCDQGIPNSDKVLVRHTNLHSGGEHSAFGLAFTWRHADLCQDFDGQDHDLRLAPSNGSLRVLAAKGSRGRPCAQVARRHEVPITAALKPNDAIHSMMESPVLSFVILES